MSFRTFTVSSVSRSATSSFQYAKSCASRIRYSNSLQLAAALRRSTANSGLDDRPLPSAIRVAIEVETRRNWIVTPKTSSFGNINVSRYTANVNAWALRQASNCLKSCMVVPSVSRQPVPRILTGNRKRANWKLDANTLRAPLSDLRHTPLPSTPATPYSPLTKPFQEHPTPHA